VKIGNVLSSSQKMNKHLMKTPGENSSKCGTKRKLHKFPIHVHGKLTPGEHSSKNVGPNEN
jgi:hypothetical protein